MEAGRGSVVSPEVFLNATPLCEGRILTFCGEAQDPEGFPEMLASGGPASHARALPAHPQQHLPTLVPLQGGQRPPSQLGQGLGAQDEALPVSGTEAEAGTLQDNDGRFGLSPPPVASWALFGSCDFLANLFRIGRFHDAASPSR